MTERHQDNPLLDRPLELPRQLDLVLDVEKNTVGLIWKCDDMDEAIASFKALKSMAEGGQLAINLNGIKAR